MKNFFSQIEASNSHINSEKKFQSIVSKFSTFDPEVQLVKTMSIAGLRYKDIIFAFRTEDAMGFYLGPIFDPHKLGIKNAQPINIFKGHPSGKWWLKVGNYESHAWSILSETALEFTKSIT